MTIVTITDTFDEEVYADIIYKGKPLSSEEFKNLVIDYLNSDNECQDIFHIFDEEDFDILEKDLIVLNDSDRKFREEGGTTVFKMFEL